ncbi:hypothetical protein ABEB36_004802 [Hypothenemus hampei]|uniref:Transposable element P transposase n=1 Tax=Hypothenemus hampei TaxID=57062 RepID=A0ABD1EVW2_HYPHA
MDYFVATVEKVIITKGWKPLNTGSILTSLSFISIAEKCFEEGYKFLLGSRLTQDALENIFSQIRKRAGSKPSALNCLRAIKLISLSQFMSDLNNTNYCADSDLHLVDYSKFGSETRCEVQKDNFIEPVNEDFTITDKSNIYYIAGSCINHILNGKTICNKCKAFITNNNLEIDENNHENAQLTHCLNFGGLQTVSKFIFGVFEKLEAAIQSNMSAFVYNDFSMKTLLQISIEENKQYFPVCCDVLRHLLKHYLTIRALGIKSIEKDSNTQNQRSYGSKSMRTN